jgi:hypothetical protein
LGLSSQPLLAQDLNDQEEVFDEFFEAGTSADQEQEEQVVEDDEEAPAQFGSEPLPTLYREEEPEEVRIQQEPRYIKHPNAKKGLIRITKDKVYRYKVPVSPQSRSASFRVGNYNPGDLKADRDGGEVFFEDIYTKSGSAVVLMDYGWDWLKGPLGRLNLKIGSGLFLATGQGRFKDQNASLEAREGFTFYMFPNQISANYRLQFSDKQWLVPYAEGGLDPILFVETRDDGGSTKFGGTLHAHGAGGIALSLKRFNEDTMYELDRDYGINDIWLAVEFRMLIAVMNKFDFSGNLINAGIVADF